MKKKLLLILFIIILLPVFVFAKEKPFYRKFASKPIENYPGRSLLSKTIEQKDNYYTISELDNNNNFAISIKKYDSNINLIKEESFENTIFIEATNDDNYLYILSLISEEIPQILKIDYELNIVSSYTFNQEETEYLQSIYNMYINNNIDFMTIKNKCINILTENFIIQIDLDLKNSQLVDGNTSNIEEYFPKFYKLMYLNAMAYDSNKDYQVYIAEGPCPRDMLSPCNLKINFLDNNGSILWSKNIADYSEDANAYIYVNDVKIVDEYVIVLKSINSDEKSYTKIVIYNFNGDIVQEINNNSNIFYNSILPTSLGFEVLKIDDFRKCSMLKNFDSAEFSSKNISPIMQLPCRVVQSEEFYYLYYFINSKVTGNGKIEVPDKAKAGEQVSFKTQADSNYTVKNVTVKDITGNIINVNNGSFIMPEEDVIIEAEFVILRNPYTRGGLIVLIGIISISVGSYFLIIKRQKLERS